MPTLNVYLDMELYFGDSVPKKKFSMLKNEALNGRLLGYQKEQSVFNFSRNWVF